MHKELSEKFVFTPGLSVTALLTLTLHPLMPFTVKVTV
jgi:hypothetical protein